MHGRLFLFIPMACSGASYCLRGDCALTVRILPFLLHFLTRLDCLLRISFNLSKFFISVIANVFKRTRSEEQFLISELRQYMKSWQTPTFINVLIITETIGWIAYESVYHTSENKSFGKFAKIILLEI